MSARVAAVLWVVTALMLLPAAGCGKRTMDWYCAADGADRIGAAKRLAVAAEAVYYLGDGGKSAGRLPGGDWPELASLAAGELTQRGYTVVVLAALPPTAPPPTTQTSGDADRPKATPRLLIEHFGAAREAGADLLLELTVQLERKLRTALWIIPVSADFWRTGRQDLVRRISLRISSPADQSVLSVITVRYDHPRKEVQEALADVLLGVDLIRRGRPNGQLQLAGKPGEPPKDYPAAPAPPVPFSPS